MEEVAKIGTEGGDVPNDLRFNQDNLNRTCLNTLLFTNLHTSQGYASAHSYTRAHTQAHTCVF